MEPGCPDQTNVDHLPDVTEDLITAFLKAVAPLLGATRRRASRPSRPSSLSWITTSTTPLSDHPSGELPTIC